MTPFIGITCFTFFVTQKYELVKKLIWSNIPAPGGSMPLRVID